MTLRESVFVGMAKLGSRLAEPIAFFITSVSMPGPISAISGTSLNLITGIGRSLYKFSRHPRAAGLRAGPAGEDAEREVELTQMAMQVRHAN